MGLAASLIARLGLDTSGFRSDLASAATAAEGAHNKMAQGASRSAGAHDRLLESNNRVTNQIEGFARHALSGASATEVFAGSLGRLENALNLSLGAGAALAAGGVAIAKIAQVREEYRKLKDEISGLLERKVPADFLSLNSIDARLEKTTAAIEKLRSKDSATGLFGKIGEFLRDASAADTIFKNGAPAGRTDPKAERQVDLRKLTEALTADLGAISDKARQQNDIAEFKAPDFLKKAIETSDSFKQKIAETGTPGSPKENQLLSEQLRRELEIVLADIAQGVADKRQERAAASLGEIAARPKEFDGSISLRAFHEGEQAREALKEIELARRARETLGGQAGLEQAQIHLNRADSIKNGIESLKNSEKDLTGAFRGALDSSQILAGIKAAVEKFSFANQ